MYPFLLAVQTFSKAIFVAPLKKKTIEKINFALKNLKADPLFHYTIRLFSDGEPALASSTNQKYIKTNIGFTITTSTLNKASIAERAIFSFKKAMLLHLAIMNEPIRNWQKYYQEVVGNLNFKSDNAPSKTELRRYYRRIFDLYFNNTTRTTEIKIPNYKVCETTSQYICSSKHISIFSLCKKKSFKYILFL